MLNVVIFYMFNDMYNVYSDKNWFNFVTYLGTPFFEKTVNYNSLCVVFFKNGSKIQIAHTLLEYTCISTCISISNAVAITKTRVVARLVISS